MGTSYFTELERINRKIDRPEILYLNDNRLHNKGFSTFLDIKYYLQYTEGFQIKMKDGNIHEFKVKNNIPPKDFSDIKESKIIQNTRYTQIYKDLELPFFINIFLKGTSNQLIDNKTGEILGWSKSIWKKKYNFIFIDTGYLLNDKSCGEYRYHEILKKVIKGESNAK